MGIKFIHGVLIVCLFVRLCLSFRLVLEDMFADMRLYVRMLKVLCLATPVNS